MLNISRGKITNKIKLGFTIIEVIIVLVIAAIIMLAVFLVVPQLQRTQRNSRAQTVARQAYTAAEQYASNNNGTYPTTLAGITDITGPLKNGSNETYTGTTGAPTLTSAMSVNNSVPACNSTSDAGGYGTGTKFKIVVTQETGGSTTGGFFCIGTN